MSDVRLVYVAGPFRAANAYLVEMNVRKAEAVALQVWQAGAAALCPHTMGRFYEGGADDEVWLEGFLEMMRRCDAVMLVEGWSMSSGTRAEVEEAKRLGLPVFRTADEFAAWLISGEDETVDFEPADWAVGGES